MNIKKLLICSENTDSGIANREITQHIIILTKIINELFCFVLNLFIMYIYY